MPVASEPVPAEPPDTGCPVRAALAVADRALVRNVHVPYAARRFVRAQLLAWGLPGLIDTCELIGSELASNALEHGTGEFTGVRLELHGELHRGRHNGAAVIVKVWDGNAAALPEAAHAPDLLAEHGRGLWLTSALADTWGAYRTRPAGKVVWARIGPGGGTGTKTRSE